LASGRSSSVAMTGNADERIRESLEAIYASESCQILATLIRLLGDFDLAEDALHDAFRAALERWSKEGVPANPRAWLISTGVSRALIRCGVAFVSTLRRRRLANNSTVRRATLRRSTTRASKTIDFA